ncbi:hypothetical protein VP01_1152g7 [Puccinia sorghi]|uniref:Uncharacterized protein n=1 Tax=Puccinia sorghi TaxID=27349 RepID=A0A0L6VT52_9BASI|nr:hypothetical protein VP01_1152g7 [Puccinia sorghi]
MFGTGRWFQGGTGGEGFNSILHFSKFKDLFKRTITTKSKHVFGLENDHQHIPLKHNGSSTLYRGDRLLTMKDGIKVFLVDKSRINYAFTDQMTPAGLLKKMTSRKELIFTSSSELKKLLDSFKIFLNLAKYLFLFFNNLFQYHYQHFFQLNTKISTKNRGVLVEKIENHPGISLIMSMTRKSHHLLVLCVFQKYQRILTKQPRSKIKKSSVNTENINMNYHSKQISNILSSKEKPSTSPDSRPSPKSDPVSHFHGTRMYQSSKIDQHSGKEISKIAHREVLKDEYWCLQLGCAQENIYIKTENQKQILDKDFESLSKNLLSLRKKKINLSTIAPAQPPPFQNRSRASKYVVECHLKCILITFAMPVLNIPASYQYLGVVILNMPSDLPLRRTSAKPKPTSMPQLTNRTRTPLPLKKPLLLLPPLAQTPLLLLVENSGQLKLQFIFKRKVTVNVVLVLLPKRKLTLPKNLVSCCVALLAASEVTLHIQVYTNIQRNQCIYKKKKKKSNLTKNQFSF